uniref:Uncharacterized protein n=1 Tax=Avena sativa TaxID=4498 RepID=A0ACD6AAJ6_AVESA
MKHRRGGARFASWFGCMSQSAVAVADPLEKKQLPPYSPINATRGRRSISGKRRRSVPEEGAGGDAGGGVSKVKAKAAAAVAGGVHGLIKGFKSLSQMFTVYDHGEEEEEEAAEVHQEKEIEIGYPTDVKHIGHIGWDPTAGGMVSFNMPSPPLDPSIPWTPPRRRPHTTCTH